MFVLIHITSITLICWLLVVLLKHAQPKINQKIITASLTFCLIFPLLASFNIPLQVQTSFDEQININHSEWLPSSLIKPQEKNRKKKSDEDLTQPQEFSQSKDQKTQLMTVIVMFWLVGILYVLFRHGRSIVHIRGLINTAKVFDFKLQNTHHINKKIHILQHRDAKIPFLYVAAEICIVLPERASHWDDNNLHDVIQHELCHYRRKDHWLVWLSLLISAVYWFHPVIRYLLKKQRQYIELACDQQLLSEGMNKHSYAESLMLVTRDFKQAQSVIGMATEPHLLSSRIHSIISESSHTVSIKHKCIILAGTLLLTTAGCIQVDQTEPLEASNMIQLISHDLPLIRNEKIPRGDLHLSAFYDGHDRQNTYLHLQLENQDSRQGWIRLGPLKKFTEHIHTWHFRLSEGVELTGQYKISGVEPDGVIDGIAIGLVSLSHSGEFKILKTQGPIISEVPNVLCSWPLWMGERKFNKVLPQLTYSKPESVQRLLCGSQLMGNGEYAFSF